MKFIDTIELLTEILVGKKEETRSQKKRRTDVKTKRKTTKKKSKDCVYNITNNICSAKESETTDIFLTHGQPFIWETFVP